MAISQTAYIHKDYIEDEEGCQVAFINKERDLTIGFMTFVNNDEDVKKLIECLNNYIKYKSFTNPNLPNNNTLT